ncbi:UNVERIFIED_CONTAM: type III secretory pathway component EscR [Paenibacillus sp. PvR008]
MKYPNQDQAANLQQRCPEDQIQIANTEQVMRIAQEGMDKYRRTLDKLAKN